MLAVCSALMTLAACQTSVSGAGTVRPVLPALPGNLVAGCADPGVRAGRDARGELARNRQALATCARRHRDTVAFYDGIRAGLGGAATRR